MLSETDQYLHFICSLLSNIQHFFIILNASFCLPLSCFCLQRDGPLKVMKPFKNIKNINHNLLAQLGWSPLTGKKTCPQESLMSGTVYSSNHPGSLLHYKHTTASWSISLSLFCICSIVFSHCRNNSCLSLCALRNSSAVLSNSI